MKVDKLASVNQCNIQKNNGRLSFQATKKPLPFSVFVSTLLKPPSTLPNGCEYANSDFAQHILRLASKKNGQTPIITKFLNMFNYIFENRVFDINGENLLDIELLNKLGGEIFSYRIFPNGHIANIQHKKLYQYRSCKFSMFDLNGNNRRFRIEDLDVNDGIQCNLYGKTKKTDNSTVVALSDRDHKTGKLISIEKSVNGRLDFAYVPHVSYKDSSVSIKIKRMFGDYLGTFYEEDGSYYVFKRKSAPRRGGLKSEKTDAKEAICIILQKQSNLIVEKYNADGILTKKGVVISYANIVDEIMRLRRSGEKLKDWLSDNVVFLD